MISQGTGFEGLVRPFETKPVLIAISIGRVGQGRDPDPNVVVLIGKGGDAKTFSYSSHSHSETGDILAAKYKEIKRTEKKVRIESKDDPSSFVEVKRLESVILKHESSDAKIKHTFKYPKDE